MGPTWRVLADEPPDWLVQTVRDYLTGDRTPTLARPGYYAAQLLQQRGITDPTTLQGFLNPDRYQPTSPFAFGSEMDRAIARLQQAREHQERVVIWGDFDADGVTATAVLWEGLGQFFEPYQHLIYFIPNRLTESHGLSRSGLDRLAAQGCRLIVTCDTGSTNQDELDYAASLGLDVIVTDHHTLPVERPPVVAIVNPRALPADHPLAHLSGVAVAYKLVEALYQTLPTVPQQSLEALLDLVAIGLIADLVQLTGDCRYLAQRGIERLQVQANPDTATRPGLTRLLELCKRSGDRPTDISFGLGPRINAVSRIYGDAHFCVELLTSRDQRRCVELAGAAELANARRKALQRDVADQVRQKLAQMDLSTLGAIVLVDTQWPVGVLGLVAGQIAQDYGRPTILLNADVEREGQVPIARGSARSVHQIDLYRLVHQQAHLLHRFGGHPFAAGLSLPVENIPLFTDAINQELRQQNFPITDSDGQASATPAIRADLTVTVAELGRELFRELRLLEPYGIGNPVPRLLLRDCWFERVRHFNIKDWKGQKLRYIRTDFELWDRSTDRGCAGVWWEHYQDDIPTGRCDAIVELNYNASRKTYDLRLIAVRVCQSQMDVRQAYQQDWILDWRSIRGEPSPDILEVTQSPTSWADLQGWLRRARQSGKSLAIAYPPPREETPLQVWQRLVGIAKYLSRTEQTASRLQLYEKLGVSDRVLQLGFQILSAMGFQIRYQDGAFQVTRSTLAPSAPDASIPRHRERFLTTLQEEQFRQQYFYRVSIEVIRAMVGQMISI
ncbi:single-stranded-DNA-specific exonuclease RecJ [Leptolyngbya sp. 'hensonii']|nr:single-stranded-DNA-specific exonuclease RecJ [Leptolyngbya sp. 'hensonii']